MSRSNVAETLGIHLRKEIIAEIEARGEAIDKKKGTYAALILEKWFADGCPPVSEVDGMMQVIKKAKAEKRLKNPGKVDVWKLDPEAAYVLDGDDMVQGLMKQLGVPNVFAPFADHDKFETFVMFENHPTHWIELTLIKGHGNKRDDGLLFHAYPKASTPRYEIEKKFREHCVRIGVEHRGPVRLSQIPQEVSNRA